MQSSSDTALEALGNQVRRDILRMLAFGPKSVNDIAAAFPISRPAVSRHLGQLVNAGFAEYASEGTRNYYRLSTRGFAEIGAWLKAFAALGVDLSEQQKLAPAEPAPRPRQPVAEPAPRPQQPVARPTQRRTVAKVEVEDPYEDLSATLLDEIAADISAD